MAEWTHRICERCWFDTDKGAIGDQFRMPVQVKEIEPGICCYCGGLVVTGIFTRDDEKEVLCRGRHEEERWHEWSKVGLAPADPPTTTVTGSL